MKKIDEAPFDSIGDTLGTIAKNKLAKARDLGIGALGRAIGVNTPAAHNRLSNRIIADELTNQWLGYLATMRHAGYRMEGNANDLKQFIARHFGDDALQDVEPIINHVAPQPQQPSAGPQTGPHQAGQAGPQTGPQAGPQSTGNQAGPQPSAGPRSSAQGQSAGPQASQPNTSGGTASSAPPQPSQTTANAGPTPSTNANGIPTGQTAAFYAREATRIEQAIQQAQRDFAAAHANPRGRNLQQMADDLENKRRLLAAYKDAEANASNNATQPPPSAPTGAASNAAPPASSAPVQPPAAPQTPTRSRAPVNPITRAENRVKKDYQDRYAAQRRSMDQSDDGVTIPPSPTAVPNIKEPGQTPLFLNRQRSNVETNTPNRPEPQISMAPQAQRKHLMSQITDALSKTQAGSPQRDRLVAKLRSMKNDPKTLAKFPELGRIHLNDSFKYRGKLIETALSRSQVDQIMLALAAVERASGRRFAGPGAATMGGPQPSTSFSGNVRPQHQQQQQPHGRTAPPIGTVNASRFLTATITTQCVMDALNRHPTVMASVSATDRNAILQALNAHGGSADVQTLLRQLPNVRGSAFAAILFAVEHCP